jgi:mono/diheme cytochrome c family protein
LYASCSGCHGGDPTKNQNKIQNAASASKTLSAIAGNTGGMGFLSTTIKAAEAANIAAYIAAPF